MAAKPPLTVKCPQCSQPVQWVPESRWRPFCSARCRELDLGAWASEEYRVPAESPPDESEPPARD